jgi:hypothetical protein
MFSATETAIKGIVDGVDRWQRMLGAHSISIFTNVIDHSSRLMESAARRR